MLRSIGTPPVRTKTYAAPELEWPPMSANLAPTIAVSPLIATELPKRSNVMPSLLLSRCTSVCAAAADGKHAAASATTPILIQPLTRCACTVNDRRATRARCS